ncbi:hypothetical protein LSAT2_032725 [Lamellibrachia satsuma]|nr:hypothetical protein LSAT2_032725 [Lamellibrachia satsuma]
MFESSPEVKLVFEKFRTVDTGVALWQSNVLETHGLVVMSAMDEIISNLDDDESVYELIQEQGRSHARFGEDLTDEIFWAEYVSGCRRIHEDTCPRLMFIGLCLQALGANDSQSQPSRCRRTYHCTRWLAELGHLTRFHQTGSPWIDLLVYVLVNSTPYEGRKSLYVMSLTTHRGEKESVCDVLDNTQRGERAIEKPFLQSVKEILGDHFSPTMEDLYARTTHFILYMLVMAFNEVTAIPNGDQGR